MRKLSMFALLAALVCAVGLVAGCGGSSSSEASTPTGAETVTNNVTTGAETPTDTAAAPTDTTAAPTDTAAAPTDTAAAPVEGDVAAGKTVFETSCQGCHMNDGQDAGVGPKLAGLGLTAEQIEKQIEQPIGSMPPGLATGDDLKNVTAFVVSIQ
ncbi:MAG TPA: cytochrome c [Miltoncostaeaceae bacterium]|nr:cytochrome c [Miltoncostaeaceae bacterium]